MTEAGASVVTVGGVRATQVPQFSLTNATGRKYFLVITAMIGFDTAASQSAAFQRSHFLLHRGPATSSQQAQPHTVASTQLPSGTFEVPK
jgi:hypothetical protein